MADPGADSASGGSVWRQLRCYAGNVPIPAQDTASKVFCRPACYVSGSGCDSAVDSKIRCVKGKFKHSKLQIRGYKGARSIEHHFQNHSADFEGMKDILIKKNVIQNVFGKKYPFLDYSYLTRNKKHFAPDDYRFALTFLKTQTMVCRLGG